MDDAFRTATDLTAAIRDGDVGSRELLDHYLDRIERLNPGVNAVVALDAERARERAAAADEARANGESWGPLHGLPMTVKDCFETEGVVTTSGAPELNDHMPATDADAVARLKAAGAVVFGKTNLPLYAGDIQTFNAVYGVTRNPWNTDRITGGSSGGAAAALAAGLTGFELGSDIGGSIRNPAHFCGVFGLKPTYGIVPIRGHIPGPPGTLSEADVGVAGPMGRSVADLGLGLDVLAGADPVRSKAWRLELPPPRRSSLSDYRIAAWLDDPASPVDPSVGDVLAAAVDGLHRAGAKIDDQARPDVSFRESALLFEQLVWSIVTSGMPDDAYEFVCQVAAAPVEPDEAIMMRGARAAAMRHRSWFGFVERREQLRAAWARFFEEHDVLLCPIISVAAFPHDTEGDPTTHVLTTTVPVAGQEVSCAELTHWAGVIGVVHLPAAAVPVGRTAEGLPVGIQVVGPYLEDRTVLDVAGRIEEALGGFEAPPGFE